jgi:hypothetical protein
MIPVPSVSGTPEEKEKKFDDLSGFERTLHGVRIKELRTFREPIITACAGESGNL